MVSCGHPTRVWASACKTDPLPGNSCACGPGRAREGGLRGPTGATVPLHPTREGALIQSPAEYLRGSGAIKRLERAVVRPPEVGRGPMLGWLVRYGRAPYVLYRPPIRINAQSRIRFSKAAAFDTLKFLYFSLKAEISVSYFCFAAKNRCR